MAARQNPSGAGAAAPAAADGPSFEEALERLETIVQELEEGSLSLEQSIARYEEGMRLSRRLGQQLDQAEKRIERLAEGGPDGPVTEPMELENGEGGPAESPAARAAREPARANPRPPARPEADELPF